MKSPAFQIYPADFLADKNTLVMSAAEVGAYWLLLCVCWRENGLPDDIDELAGLARTPIKQFQVSWDKRLQRCFIKREDGKWSHNRLEKERDKQTENRAKRAKAGSRGANSRWQTDSNAITGTQPKTNNGDGKRIASDSLSDCSLQSSSSTVVEEEHPPPKPRTRKPKAVETPPPDLFPVTEGMRAWNSEHTPNLNPDVETELFLDKARAKGWTAVDWVAKWHTWMRNAKKFAEQDGPANTPLSAEARAAKDAELARRQGYGT